MEYLQSNYTLIFTVSNYGKQLTQVTKKDIRT